MIEENVVNRNASRFVVRRERVYFIIKMIITVGGREEGIQLNR